MVRGGECAGGLTRVLELQKLVDLQWLLDTMDRRQTPYRAYIEINETGKDMDGSKYAARSKYVVLKIPNRRRSVRLGSDFQVSLIEQFLLQNNGVQRRGSISHKKTFL